VQESILEQGEGGTMRAIYEPKGRAREYAELALNHRIGCDHGCTYCYAPLTMHKTREQFLKPVERKNILKLVEEDAIEMEKAGDTRSVLLCFASDPYCHQETETRLTRKIIQIFIRYGIHYTILTKGGMRSLADEDLFFLAKDLVTYATTLVFLYAEDRMKYEPNAASTGDRIKALTYLHKKGIKTWVSLEPVFDPEQTAALIKMTYPFVDLYKVGKLNYMSSDIDWHKFKTDIVAVLGSVGAKYILKEDLQIC
jgi:DNA repair photolyase